MKLNAKKVIDAEKLLTRLEASPIFDNFGEDGLFIKEFVLELIKMQPTDDVMREIFADLKAIWNEGRGFINYGKLVRLERIYTEDVNNGT